MKQKHTEKLAELTRKMGELSKQVPLLEVKDGVIQLDPNNPDHVAWYENDEEYEEVD